MTSSKQKCRLCSKQDVLCNSHIIPEFFYEQMELYDDKHRVNILSTESRNHPPYAQKGIRERLLCKRCEVRFSQLECYARRVIYGGEGIEITKNEQNYFECTVDYAKFKLFQLSILWRVGICTHSMFSSVNLGTHECVLRRMLLKERPGKTETYGCFIIYSSKHADITSNMIHCMEMADVDGVECVRLLFGGWFWSFFLSENAIDTSQKECFLQESGHLRVLKTDKGPNSYIEPLAIDLHNANRNRFDRFNE